MPIPQARTLTPGISDQNWHTNGSNFLAGLRFEKSQQDVITFDIFDAERNPVISDSDTDDAFPSLNSTFIFGDHQVRLNYGETTNRPDFKELSPSLFKDPTLDRIVIGNPNLVAAYLDNYDLRWDYYFTADQFVSLGAFYKEFTNPIESVILAGAEQITTFSNAESAENFGIEFELYTTLDKFNAGLVNQTPGTNSTSAPTTPGLIPR